jgi:hypothetical protein
VLWMNFFLNGSSKRWIFFVINSVAMMKWVQFLTCIEVFCCWICRLRLLHRFLLISFGFWLRIVQFRFRVLLAMKGTM